MEISSNGPGSTGAALPSERKNLVVRPYDQVRGRTADSECGFSGHLRRERRH